MRRFIDPLMGTVVRISGVTVLMVVAALLYYLIGESRYAFDQKFPFGYRFAATSGTVPADFSVDRDPNASILTANPEASAGIDEKEELLPPPSLSALGGVGAAVATTIDGKPFGPEHPLALQDWQPVLKAEQGATFRLFVFGTPDLKESNMTLRWMPDSGFIPEYSPHGLRLRLVRSPEGVTLNPIDIDLKAQPSGSIDLPRFVATTDEEMAKGYEFEIVATPGPNAFFATLQGLFKTSWDPTSAYSRFGAIPLFLATLIITVLALVIAVPLSFGAAAYISELAPAKVKEWLKPFIELLASVPTVVLAYFGITYVGPAFTGFAAQFGLTDILGIESSRSLATVALVMGILLIPTIATVAEDALANIPQSLRDGGDALGLTKFETLWKIILPAAKPGLIGAVLLGMARAIGETMVVWLLSGGSVRMPTLTNPLENLGQPIKGVPDAISVDMQNVSFNSPHYGHLFILATLLFIVTLIVNLTGYRIAKKGQWTH